MSNKTCDCEIYEVCEICNPEVYARMKQLQIMHNDNKCLNPNCNNEIHTRGLCKNCYVIASRAVRQGKVTWTSLVTKGKANPSKRKSATIDWLLS